MEAERFRHTAGFVRWRPDREASSCTFEQVPSIEASSIEDLLRASSFRPGA
jgi:ATP-dependent DNA ligase